MRAVKLVVRPHPGQGRSMMSALGHGGRPSWVWVPCPLALGVRIAAMAVTPAQTPNQPTWPESLLRLGSGSNSIARHLRGNDALGMGEVAVDPGHAEHLAVRRDQTDMPRVPEIGDRDHP